MEDRIQDPWQMPETKDRVYFLYIQAYDKFKFVNYI
jgi:hypothetical protein